MISQRLQKNSSLVMSSSMSNVISPILYAASSARSLAIRRNGVKIRLLVGNVAAKAMMAANAPRRHLAVLTARATITLHRSRALCGFKKKKSKRVKTERCLSYGDARRLVVSSSSSSSPAASSYASAVKTATKRVLTNAECQTPAFWVGKQPSHSGSFKIKSGPDSVYRFGNA